MCGIAGIIRFEGLRPDERHVGARMAATLRHRGPDDAGGYDDGIASLGHVRLSIIDLDDGHQPMSNEDGTVWVVFNGEIYNHRELADQLRGRGHQLRTRCDTEVLVHLYEEHGELLFEHLNGMFAVAIWDVRRRRLILARDRMGIKPLYWCADGGRVAFGSELKAILAAGDGRGRVDPRALVDYLTFGHVPAPRSILQSIHKLEPGCLAVCTAGGISIRRWWDIPFSDEADARTDKQWIEAFAATLEDAVGARLVADVPVGAFLSGGVDSSAVVTAMRRRSSGSVLTHTVGFDEPDHDERAKAREVADLLGTDHREIPVRPDAVRAAQGLTRHFDEPFAAPSAVAVYYLSQATRDRVTVSLSGDGGDEMLAGYRRYRFDLRESAMRAIAPGWLRRSAFGAAGWLYPKADWLPRVLRAKTTLQNLADDDITAHLRSISLHAGILPAMLMQPEFQADGYDPYTRGRDTFMRCSSSQLLNRLLYVDMKTLMVDEILTKVDRASMAVGLEVRVPLLDHRVVELAGRMPTLMKLNGSRDKHVLRETLDGWTQPGVSDRPKRGFDVPLDAWFRGPLREMAFDLLLSKDARCREWIEARSIQRLMREHTGRLRNNGGVLWTLLSLEMWARTYARSHVSVAARSEEPCMVCV